MQVQTLLFGHFRDYAPDGIKMDLSDGADICNLLTALSLRDCRLQKLINCRVAVNQEFAVANTLLQDGDEVAFLPPMSGG